MWIHGALRDLRASVVDVVHAGGIEADGGLCLADGSLDGHTVDRTRDKVVRPKVRRLAPTV